MEQITRETKETTISASMNLYGEGNSTIETPIGFLNHMLTLFSFHSGIDIQVTARGDIEVDSHHLMEDIGITLGAVFNDALNKQGIRRYGQQLMPMDEALTLVAVDISGRDYLGYDVSFSAEMLGNMETECIEEFFLGFVRQAKITLHFKNFTYKNNHHLCESMFKGFGQALKQAIAIESNRLPSTKGVI